MPSRSLKTLARLNGINLQRPAADGSTVPVSRPNLLKMLEALKVPVDEEALTAQSASCYIPQSLGNRPAWGISLQLYELRSERNWGIGDFADLWKFCGIAGAAGADFIGLNPLHAPFLADPERCSPYEPSNRRYLNPLYIAVDEVAGFMPNPTAEPRLDRLRQTVLVDYKSVAKTKLLALRTIWQARQGRTDPLFKDFVENGGEGLHLHALFETISQMMADLGQGAGWKSWPKEYQTVSSPQLRVIEEARADEVNFHKWLQWLAHTQLTEAKQRARRAGMRIGLYLDLAVGEALDGSATWSEPDNYVSGATIGNPPEPFATEGQDWRLAALLPNTIVAGAESPFYKLLSGSMRYAGAVRIDHAAALSRLFLVPRDGVPADGCYVSYPTETMLEVLAKASTTFQTLVIGEDLGNIPDGLRGDLADANVLSYRILSYERTAAGFIPPDAYPELALACVSTHDHQTFNGWWAGKDIEMRTRHGLVPPDATERHELERERERSEILEAFTGSVALEPEAKQKGGPQPDLTLAAYQYIADTPSLLVAVRLADLTDEASPTNIPGTSSSYPNWKPKLSVSIDDLTERPFIQTLVAAMRDRRPR